MTNIVNVSGRIDVSIEQHPRTGEWVITDHRKPSSFRVVHAQDALEFYRLLLRVEALGIDMFNYDPAGLEKLIAEATEVS